MTWSVDCFECGELISHGSSTGDDPDVINTTWFGIGEIYGYDGTLSHRDHVAIDLPIVGVCMKCIREKFPKVYEYLGPDSPAWCKCWMSDNTLPGGFCRTCKKKSYATRKRLWEGWEKVKSGTTE